MAKVNCVRFSPDGSKVISGSADKTIIIWDRVDGAF
jgi:WD40 repeat protein